MLIFLPTAAVALFTHYKNGYLKLRLTIYLAIGAFFGAFGGAYLANTLSNAWLSKIFGVFLLLSGVEQLLPQKKRK